MFRINIQARMDVFTFDDYKKYLRHQVAHNRDIRGYQTNLAEAAGCQRAFISQVLTSHINLTPDHAAALCSFWRFSDDESDFFMDLVALGRAGTEKLRGNLNRRLSKIKKQRENISHRLYIYTKQIRQYFITFILNLILH